MSSCIEIMWTCGALSEAKATARYLVEEGCCACVNIIPRVESVYSWKGKVEEAGEVIVLLKTVREKFETAKRIIEERSSYDLPAITWVVLDGSRRYLEWIEEVTGNN